MKLYLARHAQSRELMPDHSEELSAEGIRQAHCVARFLRDGGVFQPAEIWHSSAPCSFQTAAIFKDEAAWDALLLNRDDLAKHADISFCYDEICRRDKSIAIVGHKKYLQLLFSRIVGSNNAEMLELVNTGVVCLSSSDYYCGLGRSLRRWSLSWLLNPDMFEPRLAAKAS
jgi:phosphohistidine phosphatase SixA